MRASSERNAARAEGSRGASSSAFSRQARPMLKFSWSSQSSSRRSWASRKSMLAARERGRSRTCESFGLRAGVFGAAFGGGGFERLAAAGRGGGELFRRGGGAGGGRVLGSASGPCGGAKSRGFHECRWGGGWFISHSSGRCSRPPIGGGIGP